MGLITVLTDGKNNVTKKILNKELDKSAPGHIVHGNGQAFDVDAKGLMDIIEGLTQKQCLCNGIVPDKGLNSYRIGKVIKRRNEFFSFPDDLPGWIVLDFDFDKEWLSPEHVINLLSKYDPQINICSKVVSYSSSSHLYDTDTGEKLNKVDNYHIFLQINNGTRIPDYCEYLFKCLVLDGYGHIMVVRNSGAMRVKTLIDSAVWKSGGSREIFQAPPICCEGVESRKQDNIMLEDGPVIEWDDDFILSPELEISYELEVSRLKGLPEIKEESRKQKGIGRRKRLFAKKGKTGSRLIENTEEWTDSSGTTHALLGISEVIKDNKGNDLLISSIVDDPGSWKGKGIPDPVDPYIRGVRNKKVGKDIARIRVSDEDKVYIFSFHGSVEYELVWDFDGVVNKVESCTTFEDAEDSLDEIMSIDGLYNIQLTEDELGEFGKAVVDFLSRFGDQAKKSRWGTDKRTAPKTFKQAGAAKQITVKKVSGNRPDYVLKYNSMLGVGVSGTSCRIIKDEYNSETKCWETSFYRKNELFDYYANHVEYDCKGRAYSTIERWFQDESRNTFTEIHFLPDCKTFRTKDSGHVIQQGGRYNLWQGFMADRDEACDCGRILKHIKEVWCSGCEEMNEYLLTWLSELFKNPQDQGKSFIVLKSKEGAGKNIVIDKVICRLLGSHALSTAKRDDIVGRFNSHLGKNVFTYANEALFAGDKQDVSTLKSLIDPYTTYEKKGIDSVIGINRISVMFGSNEDWVVPPGLGDRRYVYPEVSNKWVNGNCLQADKEKYFGELVMEIENGGREGFLEYMLEFESEINLSNLPKSQGSQKVEDIIQSASPGVKFMVDLITEGYEQWIGYEDDNDYVNLDSLKDWDTEDVFLAEDELVDLFIKYCDKYKIQRNWVDKRKFYKSLSTAGILADSRASAEDKSKHILSNKVRKVKDESTKEKELKSVRGIELKKRGDSDVLMQIILGE